MTATMADRQRFAVSIGASALLHALVLAALLLSFLRAQRPSPVPTVDVDLTSLPLPALAAPAPKAPPAALPAPPPVAVPERQIVEPSELGEEKEPENARLLSDRNNVVPEEMVRQGDHGKDESATESRLSRGTDGPADPEPPAPAAAAPADPAPPPPPPPAPAPARAAPPRAAAKAQPPDKPQAAARPRPGPGEQRDQVAALPSLDRLLPRASDLAQAQPSEASRPRQNQGRALLNPGGEAISVRPGTRDFLPRIRPGNITMLNTKADLFAPFVRRVAGRVFENLVFALNDRRNLRDVGTGRTQVVVEATMDRSGRFADAHVVERSGVNVGMDRLLLGAAQPDTFFDANPPAGAEAADGKIHFMLLIDLNVAPVPDHRGRPSLSYSGIAGVGLK